MWLLAAVLGTLTLPTGLLSPAVAGGVLARVAPVLVFLVAVTVLAELAEQAEVFDVLAGTAARAARGRTASLFVLVVLLATATTVVLSLDTTAVLLTPVVLATAQRLRLDPFPFAVTTVWLANTASLLLPVSNLTNLLALDRLDLSALAFARRTALAALVAVAVTTAFLALWHRRSLSGRYVVPPPHRPLDRVLCAGTAAACGLLVVTLLAGVPVAVAATAAAGAATALFLLRRPEALRPGLLPWRLVLLVAGLFLVVTAVGDHGLDGLLADGVGRPLRTAFAAAAGANAVNNLPAYLAVERVVPHGQLLAVLAGVNLGPLVLPWGSLATLLWADRCRARGVPVRWTALAVAGLLLVPLLLLSTVPLLSGTATGT